MATAGTICKLGHCNSFEDRVPLGIRVHNLQMSYRALTA